MQQSNDSNDQAATPLQSEEDERSGRDIPGGTGIVGQEDIDALSDSDGDEETGGQDHSAENYEKTMPDSGVGAIQNHSDTTSDIARIEE